MNFEKTPPVYDESKSENLFQEIGLRAGEELVLEKIFSDGNSELKVGHILKGKLKNDVQIACPIEFDNGGSTSSIKSINEENGEYFIQTRTSIYKIKNKFSLKKVNNILQYESFKTAKGSVYNVSEDGRVQRIKHALDDPNYSGEDKGEKKERKPSDVMLFFDFERSGNWFDDFSAIDPITEKKVSQLIDLGVYKQIDERRYQLIRNSSQISEPFIFLRVKKDDTFKLKEVLDIDDIRDFQKRTYMPENKGLGVLFLSDRGVISNIPKIGFNTLDYKYNENGKISSMHNGNKVVSIKKNNK